MIKDTLLWEALTSWSTNIKKSYSVIEFFFKFTVKYFTDGHQILYFVKYIVFYV